MMMTHRTRTNNSKENGKEKKKAKSEDLDHLIHPFPVFLGSFPMVREYQLPRDQLCEKVL